MRLLSLSVLPLDCAIKRISDIPNPRSRIEPKLHIESSNTQIPNTSALNVNKLIFNPSSERNKVVECWIADQNEFRLSLIIKCYFL